MSRRAFIGLTRGTLGKVRDEAGMQLVDFEGRADEQPTKVERFQDYGFKSVPLAGAEVFHASLTGNPDHLVVVSVPDRRHRPTDWESGEAGMYDDQDQVVHIHRSGVDVLTTKDRVKIALGKLRFVLHLDRYAQMKVKQVSDPEDGEGTVLHVTLDAVEGKIIMSHAPEIGPDPYPED